MIDKKKAEELTASMEKELEESLRAQLTKTFNEGGKAVVARMISLANPEHKHIVMGLGELVLAELNGYCATKVSGGKDD